LQFKLIAQQAIFAPKVAVVVAAVVVAAAAVVARYVYNVLNKLLILKL